MARTVEIAPVVKAITVARSAAEAFAIFVDRIGAWWPTSTHSRARTALGEAAETVVVERHAGGRVYERLTDGRELEWGEVIAFEPGIRIAIAWCMGRPRAEATEIEVRFADQPGGTCRVTLTHAGWERLENGADMRERYDQGWVAVFETAYRSAA